MSSSNLHVVAAVRRRRAAVPGAAGRNEPSARSRCRWGCPRINSGVLIGAQKRSLKITESQRIRTLKGAECLLVSVRI